MSRKRIKNIISFVKKNRLIVITVGILVSIPAIYGCFFIPKFYAFWPNVGLDGVATLMNKNDPNLFLTIGNSHFGSGRVYNIEKAEKAYIEAIKLNSDLFEPHYQLGRIHFINGKFSSALNEIDRTLALYPDFKHAYYLRGLVYGYQGDLDQAIQGFEEFIKRDDVNWAGYNDLSWLYFRKGDYAKVKEIAGKGLEYGGGSPWLNNMYGVALMNLGERKEAKEYFERALTIADGMKPEDWGKSYPGNNPDIYEKGLEETRNVIRHNIALVKNE